jgi:two-component system response regulator VanR
LYNNSKIQLSSIEYKIISLLFENIGVYIPRENLIEQINQTGKSRVLDVHLSNLRKKVIGINIKTKAKFGYGLFIERS